MNIDDCIDNLRDELRIFQSVAFGYRDWLSRQFDENGFFHIPFGKLFELQNSKIAVVLHSQTLGEASATEKPIFHKHDYFEFVYVYRGSGINVFREKSIHLHEGDGLLLNPSILHSFYTEDSDSIVLNIAMIESLFVGTKLSLLSDNQVFNNFFVNYMYQMNLCMDYLLFPSRSDVQIRNSVENIVYEYVKKKPFYQNILQSSVVTLFAYLARLFAQTSGIDDEKQMQASQISALLEYIQENLATVTMSQLENRFSYSSRQISRLLKQHTGQTFTELLLNIRLRQAAELLSASSLTISEVSSLVGFNDSLYFGKVFKGKYGLAPSQYRKIYL